MIEQFTNRTYHRKTEIITEVKEHVGGNRLPRTPMGTEPLTGSAGGGGCTKSRSRRCTQGDFTQPRVAKMRKTLLLLGGLYCVLARERAVLQYTRAAGEVERKDWSPLSTCA